MRLLMFLMLFFSFSCKHTSDKSRLKDEGGAESSESILKWVLNASEGDAAEAQRRFAEFVNANNDLSAAAVLRYFALFPKAFNDSVRSHCEGLQNKAIMRASQAACNERNEPPSQSEKIDISEWTADSLKGSSFLQQARLYADLMVRPETRIQKSKDKTKAIANTLRAVDSYLNNLDLSAADLWRASLAKNIALAKNEGRPLTANLDKGSFDILEQSYLQTFIRNRTESEKRVDAMLSWMKDTRLVPQDWGADKATLFFLLPSDTVIFGHDMLSLKLDKNFTFAYALNSLADNFAVQADKSRPLFATYLGNLMAFSQEPAEKFDGYAFHSAEAKYNIHSSESMTRLSTTFHSRMAKDLGCSDDPMVECPALVSVYRRVLPYMFHSLRRDFVERNVQPELCKNVSSINDANCLHLKLFALFNDRSALRSVLDGNGSPIPASLNYVGLVSSQAIAKFPDAQTDVFLVNESSASKRSSSMLYLCLAFLELSGSEKFDIEEAPPHIADRIFLVTRLMQQGIEANSSDEAAQSYLEKQSVPVDKRSYCNSDMRLADPARPIQERIKYYVVDNPYFKL